MDRVGYRLYARYNKYKDNDMTSENKASVNKSVYIFGADTVTKSSEDMINRIYSIIQEQFTILVGDNQNRCDETVLQLLYKEKYKKVELYHQIQRQTPTSQNIMIEKCDYGLAIYDTPCPLPDMYSKLVMLCYLNKLTRVCSNNLNQSSLIISNKDIVKLF